MRVIGSKGAVLVALVVAMLMALPSSAMAATALMVGGMNQSTLDDYTMGLALNGAFTGVDAKSGTPWQRVSVYWPADVAPYWGTMSLGESVAEGTANLVEAIKTAYSSTPGPITVVGTSAGTLVVDEAMRQLANDPTAPPKTAVNFVVLADATQKLAGSTTYWNPFATLSGYTYGAPPQTSYDLTVVTYEYDGWADFPDRWWNSYAVANAIAGALLLHAATWVADLSKVPASDITVTQNSEGGVTTSYLIHPQTLPLVELFPQLAPMQDSLKQQIDAGYSRNDQTAGSSFPSSSVAASSVAASLAIAPNPQSSASTIDPSAGAAANSVEEKQAQSQQGLSNATAPPIDATAPPIDATAPPIDATAPPIDATAPPINATPAAVNGTQGTVDATVGVAQATPQADPQLANAARAVSSGATDLTGGKNVKASTRGGIDGTGGTGGIFGGGPDSKGVTGVDGRRGTAGAGGAGSISGNGTLGNQGGTGALGSGPAGGGLTGGAGGGPG